MALRVFNKRARRRVEVTLPASALVGFPALWPSDTPPDGWLLLDGSTHDVSDYPLLAAMLGTTWGPLGATFTLPDWRGRSPVGVGPHAHVAAVAATEGASVGTRRPSHTHASGGNHQHTANHSHTAAAHVHNSGSHRHASVAHTHSGTTHSHGVSGTSGVPNVTVSVTHQGSGTDTRSGGHTHSAGSLFGEHASSGSGTGYHGAVDGGFTDYTTPGNTGSAAPGTHASNGSEVTNSVPVSDAAAASVPYLVMHWIVKAA